VIANKMLDNEVLNWLFIYASVYIFTFYS